MIKPWLGSGVAALVSGVCLIAASMADGAVAAVCTSRTYTGSHCSGIVNYPVAIDAATETAVEAVLDSNFKLAGAALSSNPDCYHAVLGQACATAYPACVDQVSQIACKSSCTAMYTTCGPVAALLDASFFQCKQLSAQDTQPLGADGSCVDGTKLAQAAFAPKENPNGTNGTTSGGKNTTMVTPGPVLPFPCPAPFISPPPGVNISSNRNCDAVLNCCLPCPATYFFYHKGDFELVVNFQMYAALGSTILTAYIVISWLILPGRRDHPGDIVLHFAIAVMLWQAANLVLLGNPRRIQCVDDVTTSNASNNTLCGIQGAWIMIMIHASVFWAGYMIANLHAVIVWRSNFFERIKPLGVAVCWGLPGVLTFLPFFLSDVNADTAIICITAAKDMNAYFFSVQAVIVGLSFLMTISTTVHIVVVTTRATRSSGISNSGGFSETGNGSSGIGSDGLPIAKISKRRQMIRLIKANWRALTLSAAFLLIYTTYVIHNNVVLQPFAKLDAGTPWVVQWKACMVAKGQDACHDDFSSNIPPFSMLIFAAALTTSVGVWLFAVFALNFQLLREWGSLFRGDY